MLQHLNAKSINTLNNCQYIKFLSQEVQTSSYLYSYLGTRPMCVLIEMHAGY